MRGERQSIIVLTAVLLAVFSGRRAVTAADVPDTSREDEFIKTYEQEAARAANEPVLRNLAIAYHNRAVKLAEYQRWPEAIESEEKAFRLRPEEQIIRTTLAVMHNNYGLQLYQEGKYQDAVNLLRAGLDYTPEDAQLRKNIAVVYLALASEAQKKGYGDLARFHVREALNYDRENPVVYVLAGAILQETGSSGEAQEQWEKALELDPGLHDVRERLERLRKDAEIERDFKRRSFGNFALKFEGGEKQELAESIGDILKEAYRSVGKKLDYYPQREIPVIVYPGRILSELDYFPDWARGVYDGKIRIGEELERTPLLMQAVLYHEYTHAVVYLIAGAKVPLWLNEGLAEYMAEDFVKTRVRAARRRNLLKAAREDKLFALSALTDMELRTMSSMPREEIELIYAQSQSFVSYLIQRYSLYDLKRILEMLGAAQSRADSGGSPDIGQIVKKVLYDDLETLEYDWKNSLRQRTSSD